jgi:hypothetical protein
MGKPHLQDVWWPYCEVIACVFYEILGWRYGKSISLMFYSIGSEESEISFTAFPASCLGY